MKIHAFRALRPLAAAAARVASVPYDTVDESEARALARDNPDSFLRVTRPEVNLPPGTAADPEALAAAARTAFDRLRANGTLARDEQARHYVYRLTDATHTPTGIVTCCRIDDYANRVIRKHELTRPDKENERMRHIHAVGAHTGPVFLTYRDQAEVDAICARSMLAAPLYDFVAPDGIGHAIWPVDDTDGLTAAFEAVPTAYIADGHHRAAAAYRAGLTYRERRPAGAQSESDWFLAAFFGARQLRILPYNRIVRDLNGRTPRQLLEELGAIFDVIPVATPGPASPASVDLYIAQAWRRMTVRGAAGRSQTFDAALLQDRVLGPLLGIDEPRTSHRIDFVGGVHGADRLRHLVDSGQAAAAFLLYPVSIRKLMETADAGEMMPPKSTWFDPKLRSGLLVHLVTDEATDVCGEWRSRV